MVKIGQGDGELGPTTRGQGVGTPPDDVNVNGKERAIHLTKPGWERMYLTHEAKGHEILVALGNNVAKGSSKSTRATNSFQRAWKSRSVQRGRA